MARLTKLMLGCLLGMMVCQQAGAFSMLGPSPAIRPAANNPALAWQDEASYGGFNIGYNQFRTDIGGPVNLGEEYRWNVPLITYAFDRSFLEYFGSTGVQAVEDALNIISGTNYFRAGSTRAFTLTSLVNPLSTLSSNLTEFPLDTQRINFQAQALNLLDLKSMTLSVLLEELGLTTADRFSWTLRDRRLITVGTTVTTNYFVIQRNFDPATFQPTPFVNNKLYTYRIFEVAQTGFPDYADAIEFNVDGTAITPTSVATFAQTLGGYYTGLTRDDVGGLRYLYRSQNLNVERLETNITACFTNRAFSIPLVSTGLTFFSLVAQTSSPAVLLSRFPGLQITYTNTYFTNAVTQQVTGFFTNSPLQPVLSFPTLVLQTNFVTNIFQFFEYQFGNVVTNQFSPVSVGQLRLSEFIRNPILPFTVTNLINRITVSEFTTNIPSGDVFIVPTNLCGYHLIVTQNFYTVLTNTNNIFSAIGSNVTAFGTTPFTNDLDLLLFSTNYFYIAYQIEQDNNAPRLRRGIDRILFQRSNFDSLLGQTFTPITNRFNLNAVIDSTNFVQSARRVVRAPDILFTAEDLGLLADLDGPFSLRRTFANFWTNNAVINSQALAAGPGVISPQNAQIEITFNKVGAVLGNSTRAPAFLDQTTAFRYFVWGTFDGSTNAPIVYPNGGSIQALENQILIP